MNALLIARACELGETVPPEEFPQLASGFVMLAIMAGPGSLQVDSACINNRRAYEKKYERYYSKRQGETLRFGFLHVYYVDATNSDLWGRLGVTKFPTVHEYLVEYRDAVERAKREQGASLEAGGGFPAVVAQLA